MNTQGQHKSRVRFESLDPDVRREDLAYVRAVRRAARRQALGPGLGANALTSTGAVQALLLSCQVSGNALRPPHTPNLRRAADPDGHLKSFTD